MFHSMTSVLLKMSKYVYFFVCLYFSEQSEERIKTDVQARFRNIALYRKKRKKCREMEWISLGDSAVYRFDISMLLYYLCLFHVRFHCLIIVRRLVFILGFMVFTAYLYEVFRVFYQYLLDLDFDRYHKLLDTLVMRMIGSNSWTEEKKSYADIIILPTFFTVFIFVTMAPSLLLSSDVCKSLYWIDNGLVFGKVYKEFQKLDDSSTENGDSAVSSIHEDTSWEARLYKNLKMRLSFVLSRRFWKFWWQECVCGTHPFERLGESCLAHFLYGVLVVIRSVLLFIAFLVYVLPAVGIFTGIIRNAFRRATLTWKRRLVAVLKFVSTTCGIFVIYLEVVAFVYLFFQILCFVCVNILRNVSESLPYLIFLFSIVLYVKGSLTSLEDEYRNIKVQLFDIAESSLPANEDKQLVCSFRPHPELLQFTDNDENKRIPKPIFDTVCHHCMPLPKCVMTKMASLGLSVLVIGLVFSTVIHFRILGSFSRESETVITLLTVSLPRLLGLMKSEKAQELRSMHLKTRIQATMKRLIVTKSLKDEFSQESRVETSDV